MITKLLLTTRTASTVAGYLLILPLTPPCAMAGSPIEGSVCGETPHGNLDAHKHKASKKRRDWRKLHIGVDDEGFIVAAEHSQLAAVPTPPHSLFFSTRPRILSPLEATTESEFNLNPN